MFNLIKSKINKSWGLHVTDRHLRAVEVEGDIDDWRISRIGKVGLPQGVIENGIIINPQLFNDNITKLRTEAFPSLIKSPYVIVNLVEEHAFSRIIQTPPLSEEEVDEAIKWEAESNIPLPIDKVYLSWENISQAPKAQQPSPTSPQKNNLTKNTILLAAAEKTIVDDLLKSMKKAQLNPVIIESESAALVRSLFQTQNFPDPNIPMMFINLREHYTHIIVFDSKIVVLSTTTENCSEKFDTAIENTFKISAEDCEKYRQQIGWNTSDEFGKKLVEATNIPFYNLKKDIGSAISFYESKNGKSVQAIILTKEKPSKWNLFDRYLEKEMGIPVKKQGEWNPKIWPANCPYITSEKEEYNISIGLALRKLEGEF